MATKYTMAHPHLRTGASQFPAKPALSRKCYLCERTSRHGPHIGERHTLCRTHNTPGYRDTALFMLATEDRKRKERMRPRRRPRV